MTADRRLTPFNGRVAHVSLRATVAAETYVEGTKAQITAPLAEICATPAGPRDRQLLLGAAVLVLERRNDWAFVQAEADGYCGWVPGNALGVAQVATHWVAAPASHLYPEPSIKARELAALPLNARVTITGADGRFLQTAAGAFIPAQHLRAIGDWAKDPADVAASLLGTPYLWGGNSRAGIDCSGLVQAAYTACGLPCPADSDLQRGSLGAPLPEGAPYRRGDLFFWKGHVALALDPETLIHANAYSMNVAREPIAASIRRIDAQGEGLPLCVKRRN
ncbi:NlpC/P60 family protein [Phaeovulum sp.]|uniref:C40 family peptidase n=1 Tax=Phaeovulum sp. TaxID=2934796 RepID=UPI0039E3CF4B